MKNVTDFFKNYGNMMLVVLVIFLAFKSCGLSSTLTSTKKEIKALDSSLRREIKIEGLRTSKRMLYDNNAIIRTTIRPDDRMNEYDQEIQKLAK